MSYNLGTEDITVYDRTSKLNDGNHHVVRYYQDHLSNGIEIENKGLFFILFVDLREMDQILPFKLMTTRKL